VFCVNPISESCKIWVFHQAASRWLRKDIITQMKKNIKDLEGFDLDELQDKVEAHAVAVENNFIALFSADKDPLLETPIPVFDFEMN
jgi:hypothetical protein